jgi:hypothetical protein
MTESDVAGVGRSRRAVRVFGELLVIMTGVLLALWAEGWRESVAEAERAERYLTSLEPELAETAGVIQEMIEWDSTGLASADAFVAALRAERPISQDSLRSVYLLIMHNGRPTLPTLTAMLETGDLGLIQSDTLRAELSAVAQALSRTRTVLEATGESGWAVAGEMYEVVEPLWRASTLRRSDDSGAPGLSIIELVWDTDFVLLQSDPRTASSMSHFGLALGDRLGRLRSLAQQIEGLRSTLAAHRGR